jgi:hypothetical protein
MQRPGNEVSDTDKELAGDTYSIAHKDKLCPSNAGEACKNDSKNKG